MDNVNLDEKGEPLHIVMVHLLLDSLDFLKY